jgi:hypothetical protein
MTTLRLGAVSLDCADPVALAGFWSAMLDGEIAFSSDEFVAMKLGGTWLSFVRVEDFEPATWPGGTRPKQMHLDVATDDLDAAQARAVELGATVASEQPGPERWRVLLDPAGHPFCVSNQIPEPDSL